MAKHSILMRWRRRYRRMGRRCFGRKNPVAQSIASHDADKTAHELDCSIHDWKEYGQADWGICNCGYGDACKMHGDYTELRSAGRIVHDIENEGVF